MAKIASAVISAAIFWPASVFCQTPVKEPQWIEAKSVHYSIFYQPGFEEDLKFTRTWLDRAEELLKVKYGVSFSGFHISLFTVVFELHCVLPLEATTGGDGIGEPISNKLPNPGSIEVWQIAPRIPTLEVDSLLL